MPEFGANRKFKSGASVASGQFCFQVQLIPAAGLPRVFEEDWGFCAISARTCHEGSRCWLYGQSVGLR